MTAHSFTKQTLITLTAAGLMVSTLATPSSVFAQTVRNITIVPPTDSYSVNPGDKISGTLKVTNDSDTAISFHADIRDYIVQDTAGTPELLPPNTLDNRFSAASWIGVVPDSFTVSPRETQDIQFYLNIPQNAAPGGHYMAVVYTPAGQASTNGSGATITTQLGTLFKISVSGKINEFALLTGLTAPSFQENGPVTVDAQIQNEGDLHIAPKGTLVVTNMFGQTVQQMPLPSYDIFPTAARDYALKVGSYWMIGRYSARILAQYGQNNNLPLTAVVIFWVFPWRAAVVLTLAIIAVVLITFLAIERKRKQSPPTATPAK